MSTKYRRNPTVRRLKTVFDCNEIKTCRNCDSSDMTSVLSLGLIDVVDFGKKEHIRSPLELHFCNNCKLLQLKHSVNQDYLFKQYYYKSGVNRTMREALKDIVDEALTKVDIEEDDTVIDIGSNDGTLLKHYSDKYYRVGFEPAMNLYMEGYENADKVFTTFFNAKTYFKYTNTATAKIITAISMFYDLEDPNAFLQDINLCLDDNGLFVIQQNYLPDMLKNLCVDNIVHEHLQYYSLTSLNWLMKHNNLVIENIEFNDVNGGSFRVYVRKATAENLDVKPIIKTTLKYEKTAGYSNIQTYYTFAENVKYVTGKLHDFIEDLVLQRKTVYAYGASTRGNTLLQACNINDRFITAAVERNPAKWGKRMVGTNIPVISEKEAREKQPDYMLVLPWQFLEEFIKREKNYLLAGGKFIVPLPSPYIVEMTPIE